MSDEKIMDCPMCRRGLKCVENERLKAENSASIMPFEMLPLGTQTRWGKIAGVLSKTGERTYMMIDKDGGVALMPSDVVEAAKEGK